MLVKISLLLLQLSMAVRSERLVMTHVVWSHGSTTPTKTLPSDEQNGAHTWDQGLGSLTQQGREEALNLGTVLYTRYIEKLKLIKAETAEKEVYVRSKDSNRSLTSAYAALAGFVPLPAENLGTKTWPLYWLPFPVHSVPEKYEFVLDSSAACPTVEKLIPERLIQSSAFQVEENLHFLEFILEKSGFEELTWESLHEIYEALAAIKQSKNRAWPLWIDVKHFEQLKGLVDFAGAFAYADKTVGRLRGGPLLQDIVNRMKEKMACLDNDSAVRPYSCSSVINLKFYGYSADSFTVLGLLSALGATPSSLPGKASAVCVELWENNGAYDVRAYYRSGPLELTARELVISGCEDLNCTMDKFLARSEAFLPENWDKECGILTKGVVPECSEEEDKAEAQNCRDWADFGLCANQDAVRFVFCRKTCLCSEPSTQSDIRLLR